MYSSIVVPLPELLEVIQSLSHTSGEQVLFYCTSDKVMVSTTSVNVLTLLPLHTSSYTFEADDNPEEWFGVSLTELLKIIQSYKTLSTTVVTEVELVYDYNKLIVNITEEAQQSFLDFWQEKGVSTVTVKHVLVASPVPSSVVKEISNLNKDFTSDIETNVLDPKSVKDVLTQAKVAMSTTPNSLGWFLRTSEDNLFVINDQYGVFLNNPLEVSGISLNINAVNYLIRLCSVSSILETALVRGKLVVLSDIGISVLNCTTNSINSDPYLQDLPDSVEFSLPKRYFLDVLKRLPSNDGLLTGSSSQVTLQSDNFTQTLPAISTGDFRVLLNVKLFTQILSLPGDNIIVQLSPRSRFYATRVQSSDGDWLVLTQLGKR